MDWGPGLALADADDDVIEPSGLDEIWSPVRLIGFRFVFAYSVLYLFPFPIGWIPGTEPLGLRIDEALAPVFGWVAHHIIGLDGVVSAAETGSGDRLFDWGRFVFVVGLAIAATIAWSVFGRRQLSYPRLAAFHRSAVRWTLGFILSVYGFAKIFPAQFPTIPPEWMIQTLGESSPMRLLWAFMGFSRAYSMFTGFAEVLAGGLLFFRRTTTLGAAITLAVVANVAMMNLAYDVPVKLLSLHLLAAAGFLAFPDLRRLLDVLVFNRAAAPVVLGPDLHSGPLRILRVVGKALLIAAIVYSGISSGRDVRRNLILKPKPPLWGIYDGDPGGPIQRMALGYGTAIRRADGTLAKGGWSDDGAGALTLKLQGGPTVLRYKRPDGDRLLLEGTLDGKPFTQALTRRQPRSEPLEARGFHWVNEYPHNR